MAITNTQKGRIHALVAELGWSRETYRAWLHHRFGVDTCVSLQISTAAQAIDELTELVEANRAEFRATAAQVSFIQYLWMRVDYAACNEGDKLLNVFLKRKYNVDSIESLSRKQASGAIGAIKQMHVNLERKCGEVSVGRAEIDADTGKARAWAMLEDGSRVPVQLSSDKIQ